MMRTKRLGTVVAIVIGAAFALAVPDAHAAKPSDEQKKAEILAFNARFTAAILKMDNAAIINMWAEDGVSLLPGGAPIEGRAALKKMMDDVTKRMPGYKVVQQDDDWRGIEISGDWASEWANTHQVVQPPDTSKPVIEIRGKILLVLHREKNGQWKIKREAWVPSPKE